MKISENTGLKENVSLPPGFKTPAQIEARKTVTICCHHLVVCVK